MTRLGSAAAALSICVLACGISVSPAAAKVTKLEITSQQSYGTFAPGEYVWWQGKISGELSPTEKIPDLDKAAKNARGMVEYSAKISLMFPKNPKSGNGTLLVDIPNRGRVYAQALYNSLHDEPFESGTIGSRHRLSAGSRLCHRRSDVGTRPGRRFADLHR